MASIKFWLEVFEISKTIFDALIFLNSSERIPLGSRTLAVISKCPQMITL